MTKVLPSLKGVVMALIVASLSAMAVPSGFPLFHLASAQDNAVTSRPLDPPPAGITLDLDARATPEGDIFRAGFLADAAPGHQNRLYVPFRDHLEAVLQRPVELVPFRDARSLMMAMQRADIGYAMAPASVMVATHRLCDCVSPLATQPNRDGSMGLFSAVIASEEGPIDDLGDLDGVPIGIVGEGSVIAHRVGLAEFERADLQIGADQLSFFSSVDAAVSALQTGEIQALVSWLRQADGAVLFNREPVHTLPDDVRADLRIVWRSRPVPGYTHFVYSGLPEPLGTTLQAMLVGLTGSNGDAFDAIDQGSGRSFVAQELADYAPLFDAYDYWDRKAQAAQ